MLTLKNLKSPRGANKNTKRLGRGQASGQGTQAGKGHKGQWARKGGGVRIGFEGGSMPIYMRLPKRGFNNAVFKTEYAEVGLATLEQKFSSEEVCRESLIAKGIIKGKNKRLPIKILANGELKKPLVFVNIDKFTKAAADLIEKAGGRVETRQDKE